MRIVRRVCGVIAILAALTGCTVDTHVTVAIPTLPTCDKTILELNHLSSSLATKSRIPQAVPGPMRFCRYRWNNDEKKLVLIADITRSLAPIVLLRALSQLKTVNEVYGPNAVFPCPFGQGNADVAILRPKTGSELTVVEVQRDGCARVIVTHPGSVSYIAYLSTARLMTQLDAITATLSMQTKNLPKIRLTPSANFRDGQKVLVQIFGAVPGERFRISECATAAIANAAGCGGQLATQPILDTDSAGAGATMFEVHADAATKPNSTTGLRACTVQCVLMATGTSVDGKTAFVYAPLIFSK